MCQAPIRRGRIWIKLSARPRSFTYVPEVDRTNAEFWAGLVARNQLHDEPAAYSYWEKCAGKATRDA